MSQPVLITRRLLMAAVSGASVFGTGATASARTPSPQPSQKTVGPLPLVMLDPGHGGKDPGAIGVSGTFEKHIAFAAAQELKRQLEAGGRCRVALTRTRDVFIPLPERVAIAQHRGAALFVSMHADALADHTVRGASVYTSSNTASDAQTAALAARENSADRFGSGLQNLPPDVEHILASLVRQETKLGSARMAHSIVAIMQPIPPRRLRGAQGRRRAQRPG
jgi:N-acetylmuramoyl-L-alanine amidase